MFVAYVMDKIKPNDFDILPYEGLCQNLEKEGLVWAFTGGNNMVFTVPKKGYLCMQINELGLTNNDGALLVEILYREAPDGKK